MTKRDCFIFDLDGTICDVRHRRQYVATKPKNWNAWNAGLVNDTPNRAVELVYKSLHAIKGIIDADLFFVSGRSDDYRRQTETWLKHHGFAWDYLFMRKYKDNRDTETKYRQKLSSLLEEKGFKTRFGYDEIGGEDYINVSWKHIENEQ